jgi:hypothetical protein
MKKLRFTDIRFRLLASPKDVNLFVRTLPAGKKDSLFEVVKELEQAGMIEIHGQLPPPDHC